jgi:predicted lipoprotein with Yx(FWY)xxD motif
MRSVRPAPGRTTRRRAIAGSATLALAVALVMVGSSCTDDPGAVAAADRATTTTAPAAATSTTTVVAGGTAAARLRTATTELGVVLVDDAGRTLYLFTPDGTDAPTCLDQCASAWPPLRTDGAPVAGGAVAAPLLGTVARADGSRQVTYGGHPLYTFAGDARPGEVTGQGSGGSWFVVGTDGAAVRTASGGGPAY